MSLFAALACKPAATASARSHFMTGNVLTGWYFVPALPVPPVKPELLTYLPWMMIV
jgi:hypothetical protein